MIPKFFVDKRPHNGMSYEEFKTKTLNYIEKTNPDALDDTEKSFYEYTSVNLYRSRRIERVYKVSEELSNIIKSFEKPQIWMVITEDWCGDSAQNLPYIVKIAEENSLISLKILERDKNPDIMDLYLTDEKSRSIPKLIAFDEKGNELFQWGPRPKEAQDMVEFWKYSGMPKNEFIEKLHLWYSGNRGKNLEQEFLQVLCQLEEYKETH